MQKTSLSLAILLILHVSFLSAQLTVSVPFESEAWEIKANTHEFTTYKGKAALYLEGGSAIHKQADFQDGIIEFDMSFEEGRKFMGIQFRKTDENNYEEFYVRPHQSGNPDATQYTPVFNGNAAWQLYHGEGHSTAYAYNFGEWIHVKLLISENQMDVFINDMSQPLLYVHELKIPPTAGYISFSAFLGGGYFANLTYTPLDTPKLMSTEKIFSQEPGTIMEWEISPSFAAEKLTGLTTVTDFPAFSNLSWEKVEAEYTGILNLSRFSEVTLTSNTIWVRAHIEAEKAEIKKIAMGYSDRLAAFIHGQLVYSGHNQFRSRDYRYLGTIGFFDELYVPLKKGRNTLYFAVTESMGGWGIKAKLSEMEALDLSRAE